MVELTSSSPLLLAAMVALPAEQRAEFGRELTRFAADCILASGLLEAIANAHSKRVPSFAVSQAFEQSSLPAERYLKDYIAACRDARSGVLAALQHATRCAGELGFQTGQMKPVEVEE